MDGAADVEHDEEMSELVRRLGPGEWRLLRDVRLRALADAPYAFGATREEEAAREDEWWITSVTMLGWFVAFDGADAVGLIAAIPPEESGDHQVISTWVAPERRGSGLAQQLVAAVVAWALELGGSGLVLDVSEDNRRARRFYESTGFVATGEAKPLRSHPGVTTHEMRLDLDVRRCGAA
ncbi:MAG: GNAT family N-acetyltransferase [Acidimicrobiales bacterium]